MEKEVCLMDEERLDEMFDLAAYTFNAETTDKRKEHFKKIVAHSSNCGCFLEDTLKSQIIYTPCI
ncbi:GNAT family N-acetyltransferase [Enterococcus plantarum]|uniref:GNAT family N-acetyltransferase n=1 Tax=Enterococcus plantarum TaxID=1077675 RepID=UPI0021ABF609|nr:GNAT family N-acetyltransferase [Enterococcus plantarum]